MLNNKNIVVTGGAGFIGSSLIRKISGEYPDANIIIVDIFREDEKLTDVMTSYGHYKNILDFSGTIISGDIRDAELLEKLFLENDIDIFVHLAAISDTRVYNQNLVLDVNLNSIYNIFKLCERNKTQLIYASSGAVYGNVPAPQTVGNEQPLNVYGFTKLSMDNYLRARYSVNSVIGLRFFNVYGPGEWYKGKTASVILQLAQKMISGEDAILFNKSETILRDFIYIDDVVDCIVLAMHSTICGVYNVGTGIPRSFLDLFNILKQNIDYDMDPKYVDNPYVGKYQWHTEAEISDTRKDLNYHPRITLEEGIKKYVDSIAKSDVTF